MRNFRIKEQRNHLMKVRVDHQGTNQWVMTPEFKKAGSPSSSQGRFMFRGDDEAFRRQLIKMQVKDIDSNPDSHRDISYKDMVQTFKAPKRTYCWMYSNKWEPNNKFKEEIMKNIIEIKEDEVTPLEIIYHHVSCSKFRISNGVKFVFFWLIYN